ncbi:sensor domain-containing diguanylate cyclase [Shewanella submarina]|uniref:diguanylate cyclase n=1 Tax=Shewanella submarina TaxID=2016376 RepID=A0ABV7GJ18_9GAMM|nr:sensor domain-containing diguanylate cyclase [Shewanella submarina]MCL1035854.1 sensor domain-containing diguanylate cyclase [Shewanella submarina]
MPELKINSTYGVIVIKNLKPVYVDDSYAQIFGYASAQELLDGIDTFFDLIPEEYHQDVRDNYYQQSSGRMVPRGRTFKNIDRYGRIFTVLSVDHVIEWEGEPALQVTILDLSFLEDAHIQLTENKEKYKQLVTTSGQGIIIHKDFKPLMVNQAWVDLMEAPSISYVLEQANLMDFIPEKERQQVRQRYQDVISEKVQGSHNIVENVSFDGTKRYFNIYDNRIEWDGEPAIQAVIEDVTEKVELEQELKRLSVTDALTQVANRHRLDQLLKEEADRFQRYHQPFSVILIDLDHFKSINDNWGHHVGDKTLIQVAKAMTDTIRKPDNLGRWGGEEFLIICPNTELEGAMQLAEKIRLAIASQEIDKQFQVTASLGVATIGGESISQLLMRADKALYEAKSSGRNKVAASQ